MNSPKNEGALQSHLSAKVVYRDLRRIWLPEFPPRLWPVGSLGNDLGQILRNSVVFAVFSELFLPRIKRSVCLGIVGEKTRCLADYSQISRKLLKNLAGLDARVPVGNLDGD